MTAPFTRLLGRRLRGALLAGTATAAARISFFFPSFGGYGAAAASACSARWRVVVVGLVVASVARAVRASRGGRSAGQPATATTASARRGGGDAGRAYLYRLQLALGRSARGIQERLADFAASGRHRDRGGAGGAAPADRARAPARKRRHPLPRRRGARPAELHQRRDVDERHGAGRARVASRSSGCAGPPAATCRGRTRRPKRARKRSSWWWSRCWRRRGRRSKNSARPARPKIWRALLSELGGVPPDAILGLEVIWTPADPNDSMTETDVMTTYPELRSL